MHTLPSGRVSASTYLLEISLTLFVAAVTIQLDCFACAFGIAQLPVADSRDMVVVGNGDDPDGAVAQVQFFQQDDTQGDILLGAVTDAPFTLSVSNLTLGAYRFKARATSWESKRTRRSWSPTGSAADRTTPSF